MHQLIGSFLDDREILKSQQTEGTLASPRSSSMGKK